LRQERGRDFHVDQYPKGGIASVLKVGEAESPSLWCCPWERWAERGGVLAPDQYQILAVHTRRGMTRVLLFSKSILQAEFDAANHPLDETSRISGRASGE
jgi:hypothetical protein